MKMGFFVLMNFYTNCVCKIATFFIDFLAKTQSFDVILNLLVITLNHQH